MANFRFDPCPSCCGGCRTFTSQFWEMESLADLQADWEIVSGSWSIEPCGGDPGDPWTGLPQLVARTPNAVLLCRSTLDYQAQGSVCVLPTRPREYSGPSVYLLADYVDRRNYVAAGNSWASSCEMFRMINGVKQALDGWIGYLPNELVLGGNQIAVRVSPPTDWGYAPYFVYDHNAQSGRFAIASGATVGQNAPASFHAVYAGHAGIDLRTYLLGDAQPGASPYSPDGSWSWCGNYQSPYTSPAFPVPRLRVMLSGITGSPVPLSGDYVNKEFNAAVMPGGAHSLWTAGRQPATADPGAVSVRVSARVGSIEVVINSVAVLNPWRLATTIYRLEYADPDGVPIWDLDATEIPFVSTTAPLNCDNSRCTLTAF